MDRSVESQITWESAIQMVEQDLRREFLGSRPEADIEAVARESVTELFIEDLRIRTFVPVLARRAARARLKGFS